MTVFLRYAIMAIVLTMSHCAKWIDPHDMNTNAKVKLRGTVRSASFSDGDMPSTCQQVNDASNVYLKRVVALLLNAASFEQNSPDEYKGNINVHITKENYDFLLKFSKIEGKTDADTLRKLNEVLSEAMKKPYFDFSIVRSLKDYLYYTLSTPEMFTAIVAGLILIFVINCYRQRSPISYLLKYLVFGLFLIDFHRRYVHMLEEAQMNNKNTCGTWLDYLQSVFSNKDCKTPAVYPLTVFKNQMNDIVVATLSTFGSGMGDFGGKMFGSLPFPLNLILGPLMLIFSAIIFTICLASMTNLSINMSLWHFFNFRLGKDEQTNKSNRVRHERRYVEDVKIIKKESNWKAKKPVKPVKDNKVSSPEKEDRKSSPKKSDSGRVTILRPTLSKVLNLNNDN